MRPEDLWHHYPLLYHIAWGGSWPSIKKYGLLSTQVLLRSYAKSDDEIARLTQARRPHWVEIGCPGRPRAVLRDQKPLTDQGLKRALRGSAEPWQWYELINSMVFFWPTKDRLRTMISASAYAKVEHDVLVVDTKELVRLERQNIRISQMNSGCTKPMPWPRDMTLFKKFQDYPFANRRRRYGAAKAIAEICVLDRVERIAEAVLEVERGTADEVMGVLAGR